MTSLESDPVVRSYDVFISQALNEQLHVLQYPTRPAYLPFNPNQLQSAKVKPNQIRVQLEYQVPVPNNPARFCPIRAQQQALGVKILCELYFLFLIYDKSPFLHRLKFFRRRIIYILFQIVNLLKMELTLSIAFPLMNLTAILRYLF